MKGYAGKFLRANLFNGSVKKENIPSDFPKRFLRAIGFATWILYKEAG